jgi:hypothetical protein
MKVLMSLGIVITLSLIGGSVEAKAAECQAIGNVRFICDQLGPEDLAAVPGFLGAVRNYFTVASATTIGCPKVTCVT